MEKDSTQEDRTEARKNLAEFAKRTRDTESGGFGGYTAVNQPVGDEEATTAKGAYQFVEGSIVPALNRLKKYSIILQPQIKRLVRFRKKIR